MFYFCDMAEPTTPEMLDVRVLKEDALIKIEIPTNIYVRLQQLLLIGITFQDMESIQKTLNTIATKDEDPDGATYHTRTLLWLLGKIEEEADKQGLMETKKIPKDPKPNS